jgi:hypothetical protein
MSSPTEQMQVDEAPATAPTAQDAEELEKQREKEEQDRQLQLIVFKYLQQRGFQEALKAFNEEQKDITPNIDIQTLVKNAESEQSIPTGFSESISRYGSGTKNTGAKYMMAYQSLMDWVYSSLDIYKVCFRDKYFLSL